MFGTSELPFAGALTLIGFLVVVNKARKLAIWMHEAQKQEA